MAKRNKMLRRNLSMARQAHDIENPDFSGVHNQTWHILPDGTTWTRHEFEDGSAIIETPDFGKCRYLVGVHASKLLSGTTQAMAEAYGLPAAFLSICVFRASGVKPGKPLK